jgi:hypothetical protein
MKEWNILWRERWYGTPLRVTLLSSSSNYSSNPQLFTSILRLQSNSSYISSPMAFDPTRWLPTPSSELADAWRPFQRGRHSCMGENMMMPGLVIALLLTVRDIDVTLAYDSNDVSLSPELGGVAYMDGTFASKPAKGLPVTVKELRN